MKLGIHLLKMVRLFSVMKLSSLLSVKVTDNRTDPAMVDNEDVNIVSPEEEAIGVEKIVVRAGLSEILGEDLPACGNLLGYDVEVGAEMVF